MDQLPPPDADPISDFADRPPAPELLEHATHGIRLRGNAPDAFASPARHPAASANALRPAA